MRSFKLLKPVAFALALSFTSSQSFAFTPAIPPLTNFSLSQSFVPIQNLETSKDSRGLESLGVNPIITNLVSAFVTGGVVSGFKAGLSATTFLQGGIKALALEGTKTLLTSAGLDSGLTSALSLASGQFVGGILEGNLGDQLVKIGQSLGTNLAFYGLDKLATSLGMDTRLTSILSSSLGGILNQDFSLAPNIGTGVINGIGEGLLRGAVSIGIDYAVGEADLDPLLGSLATRAITGAIEGALGGGNIFGGIFNAFKDSALNVARLGVSGNDPFSQTLYLQKVLGFSEIIKQRGLANAVETYATGILHQDSIESILTSFSSVGAWLQDKLNRQDYEQVQQNGQTINRICSSTGECIDTTSDFSDVTGLKRGFEEITGTFGSDPYGNWGILTGTNTQTYADGTKVTSFFNEGNFTEIHIEAPSEGVNVDPPLFVIEASPDAESLGFNNEGSLYNFRLTSQELGMVMDVKDGALDAFSQYQYDDLSRTMGELLFEFYDGEFKLYKTPEVNLPLVTDADHQNTTYDATEFTSFTDQFSLYDPAFLKESVLDLFEPNRDFTSTRFQEGGSFLADRFDRLENALGSEVKGALFGALSKISDSFTNVAYVKDLVGFLMPAKMEQDIRLYDYERIKLREMYKSINSEFTADTIIQNASFDRNIITQNEALTQNQNLKDVNQGFSYVLGKIVQGTPFLDMGVKIVNDVYINTTQPYNSTQTEYKISINYLQPDNVPRNVEILVRTGEYDYQGNTQVGPVAAIVTFNKFDPETGKTIDRIIRVPGPLDQWNC